MSSAVDSPACSPRSERGRKKRGSRRSVPESTILLNIYDVVEHPFNYALARWLSLGIHHSGIQIGMREFAFTLEGIVVTEPHRIPRCRLTHRVLLTREATEPMVRGILEKLEKEFTPQTYDPLYLNCNAFTDAFCRCLGARCPSWVNRAPEIARSLGAKFRLRPPKITAPALEWSRILVDDDDEEEEVASPLANVSPSSVSSPEIARLAALHKLTVDIVDAKIIPTKPPDLDLLKPPLLWADALAAFDASDASPSLHLPAGVGRFVDDESVLEASTIVVDYDSDVDLRRR